MPEPARLPGGRDLPWRQRSARGVRVSRGFSDPSRGPRSGITTAGIPAPPRVCGTRLHPSRDDGLIGQGRGAPNDRSIPRNTTAQSPLPFRAGRSRLKTVLQPPRECPSRRVLPGFRIGLRSLGAPPEPRLNNLSGHRLRRPQLQLIARVGARIVGGTRDTFQRYGGRHSRPGRRSAMCDYSLEQVQSRDAVVADRLVTTSFPNTLTRGFSDVNAPRVAVCLRPGTELAFAAPPRYAGQWMPWPKRAAGSLARFRKIKVETPRVHHDALEFSDGTVVPLARIYAGQHATVLQLPRTEVNQAPTAVGEKTAFSL
jgi:hypothetical protein